MQIKLQNLKRSYGDLHAVDDISLTIPSNTVFGIIGRSGAGKSTLVRLISTLEKCDEGEIYFDDKRIDNLKKDALIAQRRRIGMIFQNFNLFASRTAGENIAYPMEIQKMDKQYIAKRVKELLALVDLEGRGDAPISTLSGGQKQRIAIARALSIEPDILFCDEATSALDPQTTRSILNLIRDIQKKMSLTVVMITHQMEVVRDACEDVAVLDDGKVVEVGKVVDLFSNPQTAVTKDFLSNLADESRTDDIVRWSEGGLYTLRFKGIHTDEPVLSKITKEFDVEFNIRGGGVQNVDDLHIGTLLCDISGDKKVVSQAVKKLREYGIVVEEDK
ncbi:MAG: methionine ABC transporter ATP-binding protein [Sphaerochaetaceae bacterium]|nr:methionine ABC transporter ATP-binding protein [Sphaerochaetaceae bacterium]